MTKLPVIYSKKPSAVKVEAGKKYFWCSCGLSEKAPFCDGKHKEHRDENGAIKMRPTMFEAKKDETLYFCNCKHSKSGMFCDGTHSKIDV